MSNIKWQWHLPLEKQSVCVWGEWANEKEKKNGGRDGVKQTR